MKSLRILKWVLDRSLEVLVMVVVAVLVLDVLWQVFTRFVLGNPSMWTEELATFMLIWVSLLGAAVALGRGAHLGIDYFVGKLPARAKVRTEVIVFSCVAAFSFLVMIVGGIDLVASMLLLGQESRGQRSARFLHHAGPHRALSVVPVRTSRSPGPDRLYPDRPAGLPLPE